MKKEDLEKFEAHNFEGAVLTEWDIEDDPAEGLKIKGDFGTKETTVSDYRHFDLFLGKYLLLLHQLFVDYYGVRRELEEYYEAGRTQKTASKSYDLVQKECKLEVNGGIL